MNKNNAHKYPSVERGCSGTTPMGETSEEIWGHFRGCFRTVEDGINNENLIDKFLMAADGNTIMNPEWVDAPFEEVYYPADLYETQKTMSDTPETDNLARGNHVVPTEFAEKPEPRTFEMWYYRPTGRMYPWVEDEKQYVESDEWERITVQEVLK